MPASAFKHELFGQFARVGKALSNANRLEILDFLAQGEYSVETLANACELSVANTSQHLQQLRQTGLVAARKEGQLVYYRLAADDVVDLVGTVRKVAEHTLADVERLVNAYLTVKDSLEPLPRKELVERAQRGLVTVLDVRPPQEFAAGHVAGALNVPVNELGKRLDELPAGQEIVAYCRGPYCVLAYEAVAELRAHGFKARRLEGGFPEWKNAGLPVEMTTAKASMS
jgi:rhodanese-related sulfurtransferase/DNA-binding transcriptional ArsR family regulator